MRGPLLQEASATREVLDDAELEVELELEAGVLDDETFAVELLVDELLVVLAEEVLVVFEVVVALFATNFPIRSGPHR